MSVRALTDVTKPRSFTRPSLTIAEHLHRIYQKITRKALLTQRGTCNSGAS